MNERGDMRKEEKIQKIQRVIENEQKEQILKDVSPHQIYEKDNIKPKQEQISTK